jgi:hypothetical protein
MAHAEPAGDLGEAGVFAVGGNADEFQPVLLLSPMEPVAPRRTTRFLVETITEWNGLYAPSACANPARRVGIKVTPRN